jgi:hypothetical protein
LREKVHTIKRISVDLETDRGTPFEERSKIINAFQTDLKHELEKAMDEFCSTDEVIRIDQLRIDLGNIEHNQFQRLFLEEFRKQLRESIVKVRTDEVLYEGQLSTTSPTSEEKKRFKKSIQDRELDALIFFLNKGAMPWWSPFESASELEAFVQSLEGKTIQYLSRLQNEIARYARSRKRLIDNFSDNAVISLLRKMYPEVFETQLIRIRFLELLFQNKLSGRLIGNWGGKSGGVRELMDKRVMLQLLTSIVESSSESDLVWSFIRLHKISFNKEDRKEWTNKNRKIQEIREFLKANVPVDSPFSAEEWYDVITAQIHVYPSDNESDDPGIELELEVEKDTEIKESVRLNYAGVVIAWPMLSVLFKARGLTVENEFIGDTSQHKAILLLNYLVSGREDLEEFEMPLNKLLCGLHPSFPLRDDLKLEEEDKTEVNELLDHIISTWKELKNTSRDGLRSSFIKRSATLEEREQSWFVKVEQSGIDILMGKIPWGYSMIKLPWMEKMIQVEW